MKTLFNYFLTAFVLSFLLTSCVNTIYPIRIPTKSPDIPENSIRKDIPRYPNNKVFAYYKFAKQKQEQLNLSIPENGYDSLLVRFWFSYPQGTYQYAEMVEMKFKSDSLPVCAYTKMRIFYNHSRDYEVINNHKDTIINAPKSGWLQLTDSLNYCNIKNLTSIDFNPMYLSLTNSERDYGNTKMTVSVEIAQNDYYKFYQFNNLEKYKEIYEVGMFYSFIKYMRKEFELRELDPDWY